MPVRASAALIVAAVVSSSLSCAFDGAGYGVYEIRGGDTLEAIAARFAVAGGAGELARLNRLDDPDVIRAGAGLLIPWTVASADLPQWQPPAPQEDPLTACEASAWDPPIAVARPGCFEAWCATSGDDEVCACLGETDRLGMELRAAGVVVARWAAAPRLEDRTGFEVREADLDGDGRPERIVATRTAVSNGLCVSTWTVAVFGAGASEPVLLDVHDYGLGSLVARDGSAGCDLLVTRWASLRDARLGRGEYLTGRRFRPSDGELVPVGPLLVRRRRGDIEELWDEAWRPTTARALVHPDAERWPGDVHAGEAVVGERRGTIVAVRPPEPELDADAEPTFLVRLDDGEELVLPHLSALALEDDPTSAWARLVARGVVLPDGYWPASAERRWRGREVALRTVRGPWSTWNLLEIDPPRGE